MPASDHFCTVLLKAHETPPLSAVLDVDISHIGRGAGQVCIARPTFWFCAAAMVLSLLQAGLQERFYLLLTCPQAVLRNTVEDEYAWKTHWNSCCIRLCLHTGSLPMTCDSRFVRFWEENEASRLFRSRPCTAATTLPAATIDGGLAIKLTSDKMEISLQSSTINFQSIHWHQSCLTFSRMDFVPHLWHKEQQKSEHAFSGCAWWTVRSSAWTRSAQWNHVASLTPSPTWVCSEPAAPFAVNRSRGKHKPHVSHETTGKNSWTVVFV